MAVTHDTDTLTSLAELERSIRQDFDGAHARALIECFDAAAHDAGLLLEGTPSEERAVTVGMFEGCEAAQRIVRHVWQRMHGSVLAA
jgi:hypothetical protein